MKHLIRCVCLLVLLIPYGIGQSPQSSAHSVHPKPLEATSAEQVWADLVEGNRRFVQGKPRSVDIIPLRQNLAKGQHPKVVVLTCSDSRVSPEILFDKSLGELFVVRSAGNIADAIGLGSIEYAVEHLGSSVLLVLGHEKCGAVTAACSGEKMPTPNLQAIVDKIAPAVTQARTHATGDELVELAIRENVHQSARDVLAGSMVLRNALKEGKLSVVEAVYSLDTGEVMRLGRGDVVRVH